MPRKKKDPDMPKRPLSSYMFYSKDRRPKIQEEKPNLQFGDYSKIIAQEWKVLDDESKEKYMELSKQDKVRYDEELKVYKEKKKTEPMPPQGLDYETMGKNFTTQDRINFHNQARQPMPGRFPPGYPYPGHPRQFPTHYMGHMGGLGGIPGVRGGQHPHMMPRFPPHQQAQYLMQQQGHPQHPQQQQQEGFGRGLGSAPYAGYYPGYGGPYPGMQGNQNHPRAQGEHKVPSRPGSNQGNAEKQAAANNPAATYANQLPRGEAGAPRSPQLTGSQASAPNQPYARQPPPGYAYQGHPGGFHGYQGPPNGAIPRHMQAGHPMPNYGFQHGASAYLKEQKQTENKSGSDDQAAGYPGQQMQMHRPGAQTSNPNQFDSLAGFGESKQDQNQHGQADATGNAPSAPEATDNWAPVEKGNYGFVQICKGSSQGKYAYYSQDDDSQGKAIVRLKDSGESLLVDLGDLRKAPPQQREVM